MAEWISYWNGEWVPKSDVKIDPFDRGFAMGDVVFDVERTFNGKLFRLQEHLERLYRSLQFFRIDCGLSIEEMSEITEEVVRRNEEMRGGGDLSVRQVVSRGVSASGTQGSPVEDFTPTVINMASPIDFKSYAKFYENGASIVIPTVRSYSSNSMEPKVKHYSRANFVLAQLQVADIDPEALPVLLDESGNITESVGANFCIVTNGVIRTSKDSSILQGVSRMVLFEIAEQLGIPVVEEELQPYDAYTANEAFLTTSSYQVLPVSNIDKRYVKDGAPGPISKQLLAAWSERVGMDIVGQALQQAGLN